MKCYLVKYRFPILGVIRIPAGGSDIAGGSMIVEAEDEEFAKDEVEFRIFNHPLTPTYTGGQLIRPVFTLVEEVHD